MYNLRVTTSVILRYLCKYYLHKSSADAKQYSLSKVFTDWQPLFPWAIQMVIQM